MTETRQHQEPQTMGTIPTRAAQENMMAQVPAVKIIVAHPSTQPQLSAENMVQQHEIPIQPPTLAKANQAHPQMIQQVLVPEGATVNMLDGQSIMVTAQKHLEPGAMISVQYSPPQPPPFPQQQKWNTTAVLPVNTISTEEADRRATAQSWRLYAASWCCCICVSPALGLLMWLAMAAFYFCKPSHERKQLRQQRAPAKAAALTACGVCIFLALAGVFMGIFIVICGEHAQKCPSIQPSCASATWPFRPHHCDIKHDRLYHDVHQVPRQPCELAHGKKTVANVSLKSDVKENGKVEVDATSKRDSKVSVTKLNFAAPKAETNVDTTDSAQEEEQTKSWGMMFPRFDFSAQHVGINNLYNGTSYAINSFLYTVKIKMALAHKEVLTFKGDTALEVDAVMAKAKGTIAAKGVEKNVVERVAQKSETAMFA